MFPANASTKQAHDTTFVTSIFRFFPYWRLFSVLLLVMFTACFLYSVNTAHLYEASASIFIHDSNKGTELSKQLEEMDVLQSKKIIDNETDIILSKPLLLEVIRSLHLYTSVYRKGTWKNNLLTASSPVNIDISNPDTQINYEKIPFRYDALAKAVLLEGKAYSLDDWHVTNYGRLRFSPNPAFRDNTVTNEYLFSLHNNTTMLRCFRERLKAKPTTKLSSIIEVTLLDESPNRAEIVLQALADAYINLGIREKNLLADKSLAFIEGRINVVEKELRGIEQKKQDYSAKNGAFDISTKGRLFLENVSANDQKLGEFNMGLATLDEVESYLSRTGSGERGLPSTVGIADPVLAQRVEKLYSTELQYESLKKTAGENNPIVLPLKAEIEKIKPDIKNLIVSQRRNLQIGKDNLSNTNNLYSLLLNNLPKTERELVDLDREQNIKSGVYSFLLQKKEETVLSRQTMLPEARLISTNVSEAPVSPNMPLIYFCAGILAILAGISTVAVKDAFGKKVQFRGQIEDATSFPILGEVSAGNSRDPIVVSEDKRTFIAEQFRRLRMVLSDFNLDPRKILITSSISGEGKSFIASNLALALALSGKKVVLLDFDLNNPALNNKLNISRDKGITDYLMKQCSLEEIIHLTDLDPNLSLILTGQLSHNPRELLMNGRTEQLLQDLAIEFDYIVIDTAPVIPVTDAYHISKFCDVTLYVIRHKFTPKIFLERMDEENKLHKLSNVGIVFNDIAASETGNYGYGRGYSYENKRNLRKAMSL